MKDTFHTFYIYIVILYRIIHYLYFKVLLLLVLTESYKDFIK